MGRRSEIELEGSTMHESLLPKSARPEYRESRWKGLLDARADRLVALGYAPRTVGRRLRAWLAFAAHYEHDGAELPTDARSREVTAYLARRYPAMDSDSYRQAWAALRLLLEREEDWACRPPRPPREPRPPSACALYAPSVPAYLAFARQHRGLRSLRFTERALRTFLEWLDTQGVRDFSSLSAVHVRDYLASRRSWKRLTVAHNASQLRCFLRYLAMEGLVAEGLAMAVAAPRLYRWSEPPERLDPDTVERVLAAIDRSTALGKRDYAVLLLAARYGMRPSDIRRLRLEEIDWRQRRIAFVQSKTQVPLELPLLRDVEAALVDYLREGRPECPAREIFVRHLAPIVPFGEHSDLREALERAFRASGIEPPEKRCGLYLLRHTAATRMLDQGAPFATISDVLGHASEDTTRVYTQVAFTGLRSVALSIAQVRS